jgi:hypothetical protein
MRDQQDNHEDAADRSREHPPQLDDAPALRRLLGGKGARDEDRLAGSMADRLRALEPPTLTGTPATAPQASQRQRTPPSAHLMFTSGTRAGERVSLDRRTVAFDQQARELADSSGSNVVASIWAQGQRFMLRHNGAVTVSGTRPALSVVTLEDGDEIALFSADGLDTRPPPP